MLIRNVPGDTEFQRPTLAIQEATDEHPPAWQGRPCSVAGIEPDGPVAGIRPDGLQPARPPIHQKDGEVIKTHCAVMIEIGHARIRGVSNAWLAKLHVQEEHVDMIDDVVAVEVRR